MHDVAELQMLSTIILQAMVNALATKVTARATFQGHLDTYRFCDNVRPPVLNQCYRLLL